MEYFCTNFDKNYLIRGLSLYQSLLNNINNFSLWIFCMDEESYSILKKLNLDHAKLISLREFEDEELLKIKKERTIKEYYATCKPATIIYTLKHSEAKQVSFIDADMYFFAPLDEIYEEMNKASIGIIPHRFHQDSKAANEKGVYNAGMVIFKRDDNAEKCLSWWDRSCRDWCYDRCEENRFADQFYINEFSKKFSGVSTVRHPGINVAYWNVDNYIFYKKSGLIYGQDKKTKEDFRLIMYHFSGVNIYNFFNTLKITHVRRYLDWKVVRLIYDPYEKSINESLAKIKKVFKEKLYGVTLSKKKEYLVKKIKQEFFSFVHIFKH